VHPLNKLSLTGAAQVEIGNYALQAWLDSSVPPLHNIFLFSLAYVLLKHREKDKAEQLALLNGIRREDIVEFVTNQARVSRGTAYYNQAVTIAFTAGGKPGDTMRCLELLANAMIQDPSSARYGYSFAIIHKRCKDVDNADTLAIQVWEGIESRTTANQFLRRVVAGAYRRKDKIINIFEAFATELEAPLWHPDLLDLLDDAWSQRSIHDVISSWHLLNSRYPNSQCLLIARLMDCTIKQKKSAAEEMRLWFSVLYQSAPIFFRKTFPFYPEADPRKRGVRVHLYEKDKIITRLYQFYFSEGLSQEAPRNYNHAHFLEETLMFGLWRHDRKTADRKQLIPYGNPQILMDLLNLYDELEGHDNQYFWKTLIERYPLEREMVYLIKHVLHSSDMDTSGAGFWANVTATNEGGNECSQHEKPSMMHFNLCDEEKVWMKQLEVLQPLTDAARKLIENKATPTALKYLICAHIYEEMSTWVRGLTIFNRYLSICGDETAVVNTDVFRPAIEQSRKLKENWDKIESWDIYYRLQAERSKGAGTTETNAAKKAKDPKRLLLGWK
jgi:hypothetical protein